MALRPKSRRQRADLLLPTCSEAADGVGASIAVSWSIIAGANGFARKTPEMVVRASVKLPCLRPSAIASAVCSEGATRLAASRAVNSLGRSGTHRVSASEPHWVSWRLE